MIGNILTEYQFEIKFKLKTGDSAYIAVIPYQILDPIVSQLLNTLTKENLHSLKEPWYVLMPELKPTSSILNEVKVFSNPLRPEGVDYKRPEDFKRNVLPHPSQSFNILKLELYEMNSVAFSCFIKPDDMFICLIDTLAIQLFKKQLANNEEVYYNISFNKSAVYSAPELENATLKIPNEDRLVEGVFEIPQLSKNRSKISFNKVKDEILSIFLNDQYHNLTLKGRGVLSKNRVILKKDNYNELCYNLKLSQTEENGGYLIGNVYRSSDSPEEEEHPEYKWVVEITDIVPAEHAFGNSLLLLFTNETWSRLNKRLDSEFPSKKIVGWYHTHLFPATDDFGLSQVDQVLHKQFFTKPWQIALLLNIEMNGKRELRSFQKFAIGEKLNENKYEIVS